MRKYNSVIGISVFCLVLVAVVLFAAAQFTVQARTGPKARAASTRSRINQAKPANTNAGMSCPMAAAMGNANAGMMGGMGNMGDMMKNMPMGGDMMKNMPMGGDMMKNMPMAGNSNTSGMGMCPMRQPEKSSKK